jgi:hypothetical protein
MWKNVVEPGRPQMTICHMRIACWMSEGTNTHSEYVILIAFSLQQWLHEHASILCYMYIVCLVMHKINMGDVIKCVVSLYV